MGVVFRPKYRARDGQIRESSIWWARFRQHGKTVRESTATSDARKAQRFLREREGKVALNIPVSPTADRLTLDAAARMIQDDYVSNGQKSGRTLVGLLAHLLAHFGGTTRLSRLTTGAVERYKATRLTEGAAPASINRELSALGRMASLARQHYDLVSPLIVTKFQERNARKGFFEAGGPGGRLHLLAPRAGRAGPSRLSHGLAEN